MLFDPKSVAIFGAGKNLNKVGGQALLHLVMGKYNGKIFPINPKKENVFNFQTIPTIKEISEQIDLAILAIPKNYIFNALEECIEDENPWVVWY